MGLFEFENLGMAGYAVKDANFKLRFFAIIFMGVVALGAVLFWRSKLLMSAEYVDVPMAKHLTNHQLYQDLEQ